MSSTPTYCPICGHHIEPVPQPAVQGWTHACRHRDHKHLIPYAISDKQRDALFAKVDEERVEA